MTRRKRALLCASLLVIALNCFMSLPAAAVSPMCGTVPQGQPDPATTVRADLTPTEAQHVITLGRSREGERVWAVEFVWTADCALGEGDINPRLGSLQGKDSSIDGAGVKAASVVDADARRLVVTLRVPRDPDALPAGKFDGILEVGSGKVGSGRANIAIQHQEPLARNVLSGRQQILWVVVLLILGVGCLAFAYLSRLVERGRPAPAAMGTGTPRTGRNSQDFTTPPGVFLIALALYPIVANLLGVETVRVPWWPVWLGVVGLFGGFMIAVLKHRAGGLPLEGGYSLAAAIAISFGAGITVWRSQYVNTPDWALSIESALALLGVVGGATATSALLLLRPSAKNGDGTLEPSVESGRSLEETRDTTPGTTPGGG